MKKKFLAVMLSASLVLSAFTGCAGLKKADYDEDDVIDAAETLCNAIADGSYKKISKLVSEDVDEDDLEKIADLLDYDDEEDFRVYAVENCMESLEYVVNKKSVEINEKKATAEVDVDIVVPDMGSYIINEDGLYEVTFTFVYEDDEWLLSDVDGVLAAYEFIDTLLNEELDPLIEEPLEPLEPVETEPSETAELSVEDYYELPADSNYSTLTTMQSQYHDLADEANIRSTEYSTLIKYYVYTECENATGTSYHLKEYYGIGGDDVTTSWGGDSITIYGDGIINNIITVHNDTDSMEDILKDQLTVEEGDGVVIASRYSDSYGSLVVVTDEYVEFWKIDECSFLGNPNTYFMQMCRVDLVDGVEPTEENQIIVNDWINMTSFERAILRGV